MPAPSETEIIMGMAILAALYIVDRIVRKKGFR